MNKVTFFTNARAAFLISLCSIEGITLYDVKPQNEGCVFSVKFRDKEKTKKLLIERKKECNETSDKTMEGFFRRNVGRVGLYVGLAVFAVFVWLWGNSVTDVVFVGNERMSDSELTSLIEESVKLPTNRNKIKLKEIRDTLTKNENISNAVVEVTGTTLKVSVLETLEKPYVEDFDHPSDIVSSYDAVITSVITYSGTPAVKAGDTVKKGQKLIIGEEKSGDDVKKIKATGAVYGRVWIKRDYLFTPKTIKLVRTGKSKTYLIPASAVKYPKSPYSKYEIEESVSDYRGPLIYQTKAVTYYETEEKEFDFDFSTEEKRITDEKVKEVEETLPKDCEKVKWWVNKKTVDKNVVLVIYYEIVVKINQGEV